MAGLVGVLLVGAVGAYAYDHSRRETIADGLVVGGVPLGGLKPDAARAKLQQQLRSSLSRPVVVTYDRQRFALSPRVAHVRARYDAMIDEAVSRSREGSIFARVGRGVTGGGVDEHLRARVVYDRRAVDRFVDGVATRLDRPPRDATISFSGSSLGAVEGQPGVTVDTRRLRRAVARELRSVSGDRTVVARASSVRPKVETAALAKRYPTVVTVDRANFKLYLWKGLRVAKEYVVAIGQIGLDTPAGLYAIQNKAVDPVWSVPNSAWAGDLAGTVVPPGPSNPIKARWMGIFDGAGIHGTDADYSLGTAASHGCVRMAIPDVIELYDQVPVGTPIYIA
ncbi:L,D-transpeptidase/peptidoglycan binding protein [Conexibacter sp. CPCC 206217]|uniref:L,D-transpeptidase family protein n=1 Tax=Conexibacter sp. CPCC 206217 TaxID=3064574 RepID=UPI0027162D94|nr:L,D-transpeptidase/peptidoglycan binding protein [Conexibacter sp. CPCC 206217]MDO8212811.1 L,D-transpeptidase/peptidoglycan binding protein [Conexibacter sp. CPCC 206217]